MSPENKTCTYLESDSEDWLATRAIPTISTLKSELPHAELTLPSTSLVSLFKNSVAATGPKEPLGPRLKS